MALMGQVDSAIGAAKHNYVRGLIDLDEFEKELAAILDGTDRRFTSPFEPFAVEFPGPDPGKRTRH